MTISEWKKKTKLSFSAIAKMLGLGSGGFMQVYRHAKFETDPSPALIQEYIRISAGAITLADLVKPKQKRSRK